MKKFIDCLNYSISKDETRHYLQGVIHYEPLKALISTNGYVMTVLKGFYSENLKNVIIGKDFCEITREYPKAEQVIPDLSKLNQENYVIEKKHYVKSKKPLPIYFCKDGIIKMDDCEEYLFKVHAENLKPLADGSSYQVKYSGQLNPVVFGLDEQFNNFYLVMPIK